MHPTANTRGRPRLWAAALALGLAGSAAYAQPQPPVVPPGATAKVDKSGALIVPLNGSVQFNPGTGKLITDVFNRNEDNLGVRPDPTNPMQVVLTGRAPALGQFVLTFADKTKATYDVIVQPDLELLKNVIRRAVPTSNIDVQPGIGNVIILSGYVTSPQDADNIVRITGSAVGGTGNNVVNAIQIGGVQQVQIDVVVASVNRTEIRSRGFDFFLNGRSFQFNSIVSGLLGPQPLGSGLPAAVTPSPDANLSFAVVPTQFFGALRALRTENLAKFLAEPKVVTQSGRPATFLSGGRQAVLGPASGINGPGVVYEPIGTQLEVLPIVYGNGKIWLDINPSIRTVNNGLGITTAFGTTPGFSEQNARTSVMLESGQTFAIGGLIQNSVSATAARVPVLGDLPYLGTVFSRVDYNEQENELVILVTPRLVEAMDCSQVPKRLPGMETRSPDDYELFLEGILEAPRGQRKVWNGKCYNAAYKCDPSFATHPTVGNVCTGPNGSCGTTPAGTWHPGGVPVTVPAGAGAAAPAPATNPGSPAVVIKPAANADWGKTPADPARAEMRMAPAAPMPPARVEVAPAVEASAPVSLPTVPDAPALPAAPAAPVVEPVPLNLPPVTLPAAPAPNPGG